MVSWLPTSESSLQFSGDSEAISILIWCGNNLCNRQQIKKQLMLMMFKLKAVGQSNDKGFLSGHKKNVPYLKANWQIVLILSHLKRGKCERQMINFYFYDDK